MSHCNLHIKIMLHKHPVIQKCIHTHEYTYVGTSILSDPSMLIQHKSKTIFQYINFSIFILVSTQLCNNVRPRFSPILIVYTQ